MYPKKINKSEVNELPLYTHEGEIVVVNDNATLSKALLHIKQHKVIGFDTESRPAFRKGQYFPVSLIQLAIPDTVYLVRVQKTGFTPALASFFADEQYLKVGISIRDDIKEMQKLGHFDAEACLDLNEIAKEMEIENAGVRNLSAIFLNMRISKGQQTTNWENDELTEKQQKYAATDAWVCLEIFQELAMKGYIDMPEYYTL